MTQLLVTGEIRIPADRALPPTSVATVRLLDTTVIDAASITVAEVELADIARKVNQGNPVNFELHGETPNPYARYTVSVHIDTDNSGNISAGDYMSVQSYPVITYGYPHHVIVEVKKVS